MVLAGNKVRASDIVTPKVRSKSATESIVNNTIQDDNDLFVDLEVGKSYTVQLILTVSSGGNESADLAVTWTFAGTASKSGRNYMGMPLAEGDSASTNVKLSATSLTSTVTYGIDSAGASTVVEWLLLEDVTVAGTLQMRWAQNATNATGTVLSTSSRILVQEVETF